MKITGWQADLSSGAVITENMAPGEEIRWPTSHWAQDPNRLAGNQVEWTDYGECACLRIFVSLEKLAFHEMMTFAERDAVRIHLEAEEEPERILAFYQFNDWWTRPFFGTSFADIPDNTGMLMTRDRAGYHFYIALPGDVFKARFAPGSKTRELNLILSSGESGLTEITELTLLKSTAPDPYTAIRMGMESAAGMNGIPLRIERIYPAVFEKLGWCSWDAFYGDVSAKGLNAKATEIAKKRIPFGWMLIDDGWLTTKDSCLEDYGADPAKFPDGLGTCIVQVKQISGVQDVGVWHAFSGYWGGIAEGSGIAGEHDFLHSRAGRILPSPDGEKAYSFYHDWHERLKGAGVSFIKVDSQSSLRSQYQGNAPIGRTAKTLHEALDRSAFASFDGKIIHCMGMAAENLFARPGTAIARSSDDFVPNREGNFEEHLLQNTYNALYHSVIMYGDCDMFWSGHPDAEKHALIRALSGGPIYVSDKVGESRAELLKRLCYSDGTILRAANPALPSPACILQDPQKAGYLKLVNVVHGVGYLAVFAFGEKCVGTECSLADINDSPYCLSPRNFAVRQYAVYDWNEQSGFLLTEGEKYYAAFGEAGDKFYLIAPVLKGIAVFGRADKYLSSHAIGQEDNGLSSGTDEPNDGNLSTDAAARNVIRSFTVREGGPLVFYAEGIPTVTCRMDNAVGTGMDENVDIRVLGGKGFYLAELPASSGELPVTIRIGTEE